MNKIILKKDNSNKLSGVLFENFYFYLYSNETIDFIDKNNKVITAKFNKHITTRATKNDSILSKYVLPFTISIIENNKVIDKSHEKLASFIKKYEIIGFDPNSNNMLMLRDFNKRQKRNTMIKPVKIQNNLDRYIDHMGNHLSVNDYVLFNYNNEKFILGQITAFNNKRLTVKRHNKDMIYNLYPSSVMLIYDEGDNLNLLKTNSILQNLKK